MIERMKTAKRVNANGVNEGTLRNAIESLP
jgi:hypothetical protein